MQSLEIEYSTSLKLIGDKSGHHRLPTLSNTSKHSDLNSISPHTLKQLLEGRYSGEVDRFVIVDSRYPYEFEAGHIRGAHNVFTKEDLFAKCFEGTREWQRSVVIFHCEFSSERGPSLLRFLRSQDRAVNKHAYPKLFYPELYLLDGGYKSFFEKHPVSQQLLIFY